MLVYRIGRTKWARQLDGEGSRLCGGRWNHPGTPCIYTSESRALAVLEYTVNINIDDIPRALSIITVDIPDHILIHSRESLPGNWRDFPAPASTREFGSDSLRSFNHPVLRFPSAIIPEEFNYVLNPLHVKASGFRIIEIADFVYDLRIKSV